MVISIRAVRRPRKLYWCDDCGGPINEPHLDLYGAADYGEKPSHLRLCLDCSRESSDEKVRVAYGELKGLIIAGNGDFRH